MHIFAYLCISRTACRLHQTLQHKWHIWTQVSIPGVLIFINFHRSALLIKYLLITLMVNSHPLAVPTIVFQPLLMNLPHLWGLAITGQTSGKRSAALWIPSVKDVVRGAASTKAATSWFLAADQQPLEPIPKVLTASWKFGSYLWELLWTRRLVDCFHWLGP